MKLTFVDGLILTALAFLILIGTVGVVFATVYEPPEPRVIIETVEKIVTIKEPCDLECSVKIEPTPKPVERDPKLIIEHRGDYTYIYLKNGLSRSIYVDGLNRDTTISHDCAGHIYAPMHILPIVPHDKIGPGEKFLLLKWDQKYNTILDWEQVIGEPAPGGHYIVKTKYYLNSDPWDTDDYVSLSEEFYLHKTPILACY